MEILRKRAASTSILPQKKVGPSPSQVRKAKGIIVVAITQTSGLPGITYLFTTS
jgi:hypothetical protein